MLSDPLCSICLLGGRSSLEYQGYYPNIEIVPLYWNLLKTLEASHGEYIIFLGPDDDLLADSIDAKMSRLSTDRTLALAAHTMSFFLAADASPKPGSAAESVASIPVCNAIFRRDLANFVAAAGLNMSAAERWLAMHPESGFTLIQAPGSIQRYIGEAVCLQ